MRRVSRAWLEHIRRRAACSRVAHVGNGGDVGEHAGVRTPHRVVDAGDRLPTAREPDEDRLAHEHRSAARPTRSPSPDCCLRTIPQPTSAGRSVPRSLTTRTPRSGGWVVSNAERSEARGAGRPAVLVPALRAVRPVRETTGSGLVRREGRSPTRLQPTTGRRTASYCRHMPVKFGLWRVDGTQVQQVPAAIVASEERLEEIIEARIDILGLGTLFQIGRQVITDYGKRIDILAIDAQGDLHVVELKKDRTPREVVAQNSSTGSGSRVCRSRRSASCTPSTIRATISTRRSRVSSRLICPRPSTRATISWWSRPAWMPARNRSSSTSAATACRSTSCSSSTCRTTIANTSPGPGSETRRSRLLVARPVRSRLRGTASTSSSRSGRTSIETGMTCVAMASSRPRGALGRSRAHRAARREQQHAPHPIRRRADPRAEQERCSQSRGSGRAREGRFRAYVEWVRVSRTRSSNAKNCWRRASSVRGSSGAFGQLRLFGSR